MATTASRPRRKDPALRRQEILDAVGQIALAEGLEAVSNRRVADRLDCAPGLVHHYFPVAVDLLAEALRQVLVADQERAFGAAEAHDDPLAGLSALLRGWRVDTTDDYALLWLDAWSLARRHPQVRATVDDVMRSGHDRLTALVRRGVDDGTFAPVDPQAVAWHLLTALDGVIVHGAVRVNQGLVDVTRTIATFTEQELGLAPGSLRLPA